MNKSLLKLIPLGILQAIVGFTSIVTVCTILGINIANGFLLAGLSTLAFHLLTKNKIPITIGCSGMYISGILYISNTYGMEYVPLSVVVSGVIIFIIGFLIRNHQDTLMKHVPDWFLATSIMLVGLNLLPIAKDMMSANYTLGIITLLVVAILDLKGSDKLSLWAMPIGVMVGFVVSLLTGNVDFSVLNEAITLQAMPLKFHLGAVLSLSVVAIPAIAESLGDIKNTSLIVGKDFYKEVGIGRITMANGISNIVGGLSGSQGGTTYSECSNHLRMIKNYNPNIQIIAAITFIIFSLTPLLSVVRLINPAILAGGVCYIFATMLTGSLTTIVDSGLTHRKSTIISIMIALNFIPFTIYGVAISSTTVALVVGFILNYIISRKAD